MLSFIVNCFLTASVFYNIHQSFKQKDRESRKFYKRYFIVLSMILSADNMLSAVLYRVPYYLIFKLALLLWFSIPMSTGPHFVYNVYIKNISKLFEGDIDAVITNFKNYVEQLKAKYREMVLAKGKGTTFLKSKEKMAPESSEAEFDSSNVETEIKDEKEDVKLE